MDFDPSKASPDIFSALFGTLRFFRNLDRERCEMKFAAGVVAASRALVGRC